ncbi:arginase family protein [Microbacterium aurantiacum]|uniref:Arginase family protein n=1 Tax=Microbacterium aurantiacum TaxID=162393 RepID=A0ABT8FQZ1_9MICO|nr:arginase family protein [Microbacterium aurantiacum]MDN4463611.1 arginase family protein [Microbacterium aurantiacum]
MTRFIVVPQWQGSASSRAMQLIDGAEALAGDLPRPRTVVVDVPMEAGEALDTGVLRASSLRRIRAQLDAALELSAEPVLTVGGDAGVAPAAIAHAAARCSRLAVLWVAAHPALHDPSSSPSGAFETMALGAALGRTDAGLGLAPGTVAPERVLLAAARAADTAEETVAAALGIRSFMIPGDTDGLLAALSGVGADGLYVHVDVAALDPSAVTGMVRPVPFGPSVTELTAAVAGARERVPLVGASLSGYSPASAAVATDDLGPLLRIVGALA